MEGWEKVVELRRGGRDGWGGWEGVGGGRR